MTSQTLTTCGTGTFDDRVQGVIHRLRTSIRDVLDALCLPVPEAIRLDQRIGIDKTLAWRIAKVLQHPDVCAAARHVPGPTAMSRFLDRAAKEVPRNLIESVRASARLFEAMIVELAGDRKSFDRMLCGHVASSDQEESDVAHRREASQAQSYIWGVEAKAQFKVDILHPGADPDRVDVASVRGFIDLRWIRPNIPWSISRMRITDDDGVVRRREPCEPIARPAEGQRLEVPFLPQFCSKGIPAVRRVESANGFVEDEVLSSTVGNASALTCITGEVNRGIAPRRRDEHNSLANHIVRARTPCDLIVFDVLVHEQLLRGVAPTLKIFGDLETGCDQVPVARRTRHRLLAWHTVQSLGDGPAAAYSQHLPHHTEMIEYCMNELGWDGRDFRTWRAQIPYPVIPSSIVIQFALPNQ